MNFHSTITERGGSRIPFIHLRIIQIRIHQFHSSFQTHHTIDDVFHQVLKGEADIGVVPVENSSEGVINTTLNCLADNDSLSIIGEIYLDINHQLASGNKFDIKDAFAIASHPKL